MSSLNKVLLMGNLTRNPELRAAGSGSVCEFGLAMNRKFVVNGQERDETCFVDIAVWGKQAESCNRYLQKGSCVFVEGRLTLDKWIDRDSQKTRTRIRVTADRVQFISSANAGHRLEQSPGSDVAEMDAETSYSPKSSGYSASQGDYPSHGAPYGGDSYSRKTALSSHDFDNANDNGPLDNVDDIPF